MSEWWTYTLSDLILFSSHAYFRLIELYNAAIWPAQIVALFLGVGILVLARRGSSGRWVAVILAACWLWIAFAFHAARYARLNTAAPYFAWMFGIEAVLLLVLGRVTFQGTPDLQGRIGLALFLFALVAMPLAAPLLGRGWRAAEVFGVAPDPTAVGTLGILLLARAKRRWPLIILPAAWCVLTGAVLSVWKTPFFWVTPLAALIAVLLARRR